MRETFGNALADRMDRRRAELGLRWADVADRGGITTQTLREVRAGTRRPRGLTKAAIERALEWTPGSVDAALEGGEPAPVVTDPREGDPTPEQAVSTLLENIVKVRRSFGDDAARAFIEGAFARPVESQANRELPPGGTSAAG
jgi:hypothetical protein